MRSWIGVLFAGVLACDNLTTDPGIDSKCGCQTLFKTVECGVLGRTIEIPRPTDSNEMTVGESVRVVDWTGGDVCPVTITLLSKYAPFTFNDATLPVARIRWKVFEAEYEAEVDAVGTQFTIEASSVTIDAFLDAWSSVGGGPVMVSGAIGFYAVSDPIPPIRTLRALGVSMEESVILVRPPFANTVQTIYRFDGISVPEFSLVFRMTNGGYAYWREFGVNEHFDIPIHLAMDVSRIQIINKSPNPGTTYHVLFGLF